MDNCVAVLWIAVLLTCWHHAPICAEASHPCYTASTFEELIEQGKSQVKWVKITEWNHYSFDRAHSSQPKVTAVECDPSNCITCVPKGEEIELFPPSRDRDTKDPCQSYHIGELYLVAFNSDNDVTSVPIRVDPAEWLSFRKLCYFNTPMLSNEDLTIGRCSNFQQCLSSNTTIDGLFHHSSACPQSSNSFKARLAVAGAASVVRLSMISSDENSPVEMWVIPCNESFCSDLQINTTACGFNFGELSNFSRKALMKYPSQGSTCYHYNWNQSISFNQSYLIFHEKLTRDSFVTTYWIRADPLPLTADLWSPLSKLCYFVSESCRSPQCVEDADLANLTPYDDDSCESGGGDCDSDCFSKRFDGAQEVFLGKLQDSQNLVAYCYLKSEFGYDSYTITDYASCNVPTTGQLSVFFITTAPHGNKPLASLTANPVETKSFEAWKSMVSYCGVSHSSPLLIPIQSQPVLPYCCLNMSSLGSCSTEISISKIENENPGTTTTTTPKTPSSCSEEYCPYEMCDSECFSSRFNEATDVVWAEHFENSGGENWLSVYCYLKRSRQDWSNIFIGGDPEDSGRCIGNMDVPDSGSFLIFLKPNMTNEPENNFKMIANPVPLSSLQAWTNVSSIVGVTPQRPSQPSHYLPFGSCVKDSRQQLEDIKIPKILELNQAPCPGADINMVVRFNQVSVADSRQILAYGQTSPVADKASSTISEFCAVNYVGKDETLTVLPTEETCFFASKPLDGKLAVGLDPTGEKYQPGTEPLFVDDNGFLALSKLCSLWKLPINGPRCEKLLTLTQSSSLPGCFFNLRKDQVNSTIQSLDCSKIDSDSFRQRLANSTSTIYGRVVSLNYSDQSFALEPECGLKGEIASDSILQVKIPHHLDGCFSIELNDTIILFLDQFNQLSALEIDIDPSSSQLAIFSASCGTLNQGGCTKLVDSRKGCYPDMSISSILNEHKPPLNDLILPSCCQNLNDNFNSDLFSEIEIVVWATVDTLMAVTTPNETTKDRLVAASLVSRCLMVSKGSDPPKDIATLLNLESIAIPIHVGSDYIFTLRRLADSPWLKVEFEIATIAVPASKANWAKFCNVCGMADKVDTAENDDRCGGPSICQSSHDCVDSLNLTLNSIECQADSDYFGLRVDSLNNNGAVFFGKVASTNIKSLSQDSDKANTTLQLALPLHQPVRDVVDVEFLPFCQISGLIKPSTPRISFTYYESECFCHSRFTFSTEKTYLIFVNSINLALAAAPIAINETGINLVATSCSIKPPPFAIFHNVKYYEEICPTLTPSPKLCSSSLTVSSIEVKEKPVGQKLLPNWALALVTGLGALFLASGLTLFLVRRSKKQNCLNVGAGSYPLNASVEEINPDSTSHLLFPDSLTGSQVNLILPENDSANRVPTGGTNQEQSDRDILIQLDTGTDDV